MWKKGLALLVVCLVGFSVWHESSLEAPGGGKMYRVGILQLAEHPALDAANKGFVDGLPKCAGRSIQSKHHCPAICGT